MTTVYRGDSAPPHNLGAAVGPTCTLRKIAAPSCGLKRANELAAQEKKVLFLHDDTENGSTLRLQMAELAAELDKLHITSYFRNGPARYTPSAEGEPDWAVFDGPKVKNEFEEYRLMWPNASWHDLNTFTIPLIKKIAGRKGPFWAVIGVGKAARVAKALIANEWKVPMDLLVSDEIDSYAAMTTAGIPVSKDKMNYPVFISSSRKHLHFLTEKNADATLPLKLPIQLLNDFIKEAVEGSPAEKEKQKDANEVIVKPLFQVKELSNKEKRMVKLAAREAEKELTKQRTLENKLRKELKARKAAGEDLVIPPNPAKVRKAERREIRKEANKIIPPVPPKDKKDAPAPISHISRYIGDVDNLERPVANYILQPLAEPVTPCTLDELAQMIDYLETNQKIDDKRIERIDFTKGSMLNRNGMAVDLCKQVVGPEGIEPILEAVGKNEHVVRFLLGNNISGDRGARAIAGFIADKERSKNVYHFYLAGNEIGPEGMAKIAESLAHDTKVTALWLKRNPIGPAGGRAVANMLRTNTTLQTLDLVNTGLLEDGAIPIFNALTASVDTTTLEHLYIGSNALGIRTAEAAAEFLATGKSKLTTLYFACGRFGNEGVKALARGLVHDKSLVRLGLSSESITFDGLKALVDALEQHPAIRSIDIGMRKGTFVLGERPNCIGDEGAMYICNKLINKARKPPLRALALDNNSITKEGVDAVIAHCAENSELLRMAVTQAGFSYEYRKSRIREIRTAALQKVGEMKKKVRNNQFEEGDDEAYIRNEVEAVQELMEPKHLSDIYSIYRNNM